MWIVCITSVRHVLTVNGYGGRQTKENEKSWCFKGWETLVNKISHSIVSIRKHKNVPMVIYLKLVYNTLLFTCRIRVKSNPYCHWFVTGRSA